MTDPTPAPPSAPVIDATTLAEEIAQDIMGLLTQAPAWQTAPFWVTVATMILGILVALGVLKPDVAASANVQEIIQLAAGIAAIVIPPAVYALGHFLSAHHLAAEKRVLREQIAEDIVARIRRAA